MENSNKLIYKYKVLLIINLIVLFGTIGISIYANFTLLQSYTFVLASIYLSNRSICSIIDTLYDYSTGIYKRSVEVDDDTLEKELDFLSSEISKCQKLNNVLLFHKKLSNLLTVILIGLFITIIIY